MPGNILKTLHVLFPSVLTATLLNRYYYKILGIRENCSKVIPVSGTEITLGNYAFHPEVLSSSFVALLVAWCLHVSWQLFSRDSHSVKHLAITV